MLLTQEEVKEIYKIGRSTLLRWEENGTLQKVVKLPNSNHRRYLKTEIERVLGLSSEGTL